MPAYSKRAIVSPSLTSSSNPVVSGDKIPATRANKLKNEFAVLLIFVGKQSESMLKKQLSPANTQKYVKQLLMIICIYLTETVEFRTVNMLNPKPERIRNIAPGYLLPSLD